MKHINRLIIAALLLTAPLAHATADEGGDSYIQINSETNAQKSGDLGVGLQLGYISALTFNYWVTETRSWEAVLAMGNEFNAFGVSHLWHMSENMIISGEKFSPYVGAGLFNEFNSRRGEYYRDYRERYSQLYLRIPAGIEYLPKALPLGAYLQFSGNMALDDRRYNSSWLGFEVGARMYF